jgi:hypothetical protein
MKTIRLAALAFLAFPGFPAAEEPYLQKTCRFLPAATVPPATERESLEGVEFHSELSCATVDGNRLVGSKHGIVLVRPGAEMEPFPRDRSLPWRQVTAIAEEAPDVLWIGTTRGAVRLTLRGEKSEVEYFAGKRWIPDDRVEGIGFHRARPGAVWIRTPAGVSLIEWKPMRLSEKARLFEERVRARHVRHGLTADSRLAVPGDLSTSRPVSTDNDGLWTAMYVAAECFRFKVTGEKEARDHARQGLEALLRLESITGIPGFPARSFIKVGEEPQPEDGEWHETPDGLWKWKGDTSSDEIGGHYIAWSVFHDLVADEDEKGKIRAVVARVTSHILDHGYHLVDVDGKPTRWGWWAPEEILADPDETGLRALHMLSHLSVAYHVTGDRKYEAARDELVAKHRYAHWLLHQKVNVPGHVNHSDDELAFLSYYPLLICEKDPALRGLYLESLERSWQVERPEGNPLWNTIYAALTGSSSFDATRSLRTLERIPLDLVSWTLVNSHRLDLCLDPAMDRFTRAQSLVVLPIEERAMAKWNGNPYRLDGGDGGASEDDGAFFLLPYWLARYHKLFAD